MIPIHKKNIVNNGNFIVSHEMDGKGDHILYHVNPHTKKVRITTISQVHKNGRKRTKIEDKPANESDKMKFGMKK